MCILFKRKGPQGHIWPLQRTNRQVKRANCTDKRSMISSGLEPGTFNTAQTRKRRSNQLSHELALQNLLLREIKRKKIVVLPSCILVPINTLPNTNRKHILYKKRNNRMECGRDGQWTEETRKMMTTVKRSEWGGDARVPDAVYRESGIRPWHGRIYIWTMQCDRLQLKLINHYPGMWECR